MKANETILRLPKLPVWTMAAEIGYEPKTTFWDDFSIADMIGAPESIIDTFERAFKEWSYNVEYIAELALVLNHKGFWHQETRPVLSKIYFSLWERLDTWAREYYTGEDAEYYFRVTD